MCKTWVYEKLNNILEVKIYILLYKLIITSLPIGELLSSCHL